MSGRQAVLAVIVALGACACSDAAAPDLERCVKLEEKDDLDGAIAACEQAVIKGPTSKAGQSAKARLDAMRIRLEAEKEKAALKEEAEEIEKRAGDAKDKVKALQDQLGGSDECKCDKDDPVCDCL